MRDLIVSSALLLFFPLTSCSQMSEQIQQKNAGLNGGFEITQNGLPVNWLIYSPKTVKDADFRISFDTTDFKEGKQSLRFDIKKCSSQGGWNSPGFTNEFFSSGKFEGKRTVKISFWMKNEGSKVQFSAGGVSEKSGDMKILLETDDSHSQWVLQEFEVEIPTNKWLRVQLNLLQPGKFWMDDFQVH